MNSVVLKFLQEIFQRLVIKQPKFFKVWSFISGALVIITGLPDFITMLSSHDIVIPNLWNDTVTTIVRYASSGMLLMSLLTTQSKPVAVTTTGMVIKKTDENKLPFTASEELKVADKEAVPIVEIKVSDDIKGSNSNPKKVNL